MRNRLPKRSGGAMAAALLALGLLLGTSPQARADNIVPDHLIVSHGGFDWVWASPCAGDCSPKVDPGAGGSDWRFPLEFPELAQPLLDASIADPNYFITNPLWPHWNLFNPLDLQPFTQANGKCAAHIFDVVHNHCDGVDGKGGRIDTDGMPPPSQVWETWLVRRTPAIAEPTTLALLGLGLAGLGFGRRK